MPLYELYRLTREKFDKEIDDNTCVANQSSSPENDFFELVWENGQISTQGQSSSRARKSPSSRSVPSHCLPSHSPRGRDKDVGYATTNTKMGKFGDLDSGFNEIAMTVPSGEIDLGQDGEVMPWLDYTMDGSLQHEIGSDFLHELSVSGVTEHDLPAANSFSLMDKRSNGNQVFRDSHRNSAEQMNFSKVETSRPKTSASQLYQPSSVSGRSRVSDITENNTGNTTEHAIQSNGNPVFSDSHTNSAEQGNFSKVETARPKTSAVQLYQPSFVSGRSRVSDITENNTGNTTEHVLRGEMSQIPSSSSDFSSLKMQIQDPVLPSNGSTIMNFSHFARPAVVVKANLQNIGFKSGLSSARSESMEIANKGAVATSSNPPESTVANSSGECAKEQMKADLKPLEPKSLEQNGVASKPLDPACKESAIKADQTSNQVLGEGSSKGQMTAERNREPAVASSSVCSGNGADRGSDEPNQNLKRKIRDTEDSECHSEDVEEESAGVKKAAAGRGVAGSKRSRAAEVHNLSERRRRDRINEKMRALQELIPNCNKVDKASMLDEAIEYLKTLQLQVQIMSMGAGLYMPQMMLPPGMQHMHAPHMAPFSPMSVGMHMGLGMGYGMGVPDMNGGSSRFPMIQVPQMQGAHLPVAHMSGHTALHGMGRSNPQGYGIPGQAHPMPMPHTPVFPFSGGPLMNSSALGLHARGTTGPVQTVDSASASGLKDRMPNGNVKQSTGGCDSTSQMRNQCGAATVGYEHSALVHNSSHASEVNDSGTVNPGEEHNLVNGYD